MRQDPYTVQKQHAPKNTNRCGTLVRFDGPSNRAFSKSRNKTDMARIVRARSANPTYSGWAIPVTLPEQRNARAAARRYG